MVAFQNNISYFQKALGRKALAEKKQHQYTESLPAGRKTRIKYM